MLETNLRIVGPGVGLTLPIRIATVDTALVSKDIVEKACSFLQTRYQLAAKPSGEANGQLVVLSERALETVRMEGDDLILTINDSGVSGTATFEDAPRENTLPALLERAVLIQVARRTNFWRLDSPRKWLEPSPFQTADGIAAYRRFEVSCLPVSGVGAAVSVDISTAFFTTQTLAAFYDPALSPSELKERKRAFDRLTSRQQGQKGTLTYDNGRSTTVCYFEKWDADRTCGRTPELRIGGKTYPSLHGYYTEKFPHLKIRADEPAVLVSFRGIEKAVWAAARLLRIRVMNDSLPDSLSSVDKIPPNERKRMIEQFWSLVSPEPFGLPGIDLLPGFWRPVSDRIVSVGMPCLEFGKSQVLRKPAVSAAAYKSHFRERGEMLEKAGCYHLPPATTRTIHYAYPAGTEPAAAKQLAEDVAACLLKWTGVSFNAVPVTYNVVTEASVRLRNNASAGTVLFVLDDRPASYYEIAFQLQGWRLKRVTERSLRRHYKYLSEGAWDRKERKVTQRKGWQKWDQFVHMNAYDLFQQMDGVLFRVPSLGEFEAAVAIDVGHDRRYVAVSLLVAREKAKAPSFRIVTDVHPKTDYKQDTINPVILADMIVQLFGKVFRGKYDALGSLVIIRDGEFRGEELRGVATAVMRLKEKKILETDSFTTSAELHKSSQKNIRLWECTDAGSVSNPLECTGILISPKMTVLATTGSGTLSQGTAEPIVIESESANSMTRITEAVAVSAQLNWSSPTVAQRLPLVFKRTDEELEVRAAQEIRRIA